MQHSAKSEASDKIGEVSFFGFWFLVFDDDETARQPEVAPRAAKTSLRRHLRNHRK